ncbi:hypothetical protein Syn7502_03460 [Synechococcus sp. PCC 7502]|uniref:hypothetical protein n=1 Tax=Synechococcus sp. PCC 7502 TaxID=1173263 RepID=UPI00029F8B8C|nr:hypothetical protein [Synechococcus sp. PCC 7502]AFY75309.1 hypothetical protein Syn7502_03460 [Synechococcus sp. PCC 7502]
MSLDFPPDLQSNLQELQDYYQKLVDHATSQLAHVQALLQSPVAPSVPTIPEESVVKEITPPASKKKAKPAIFSPSVPVSTPVVKTSGKGKAKTKTTTKIKPSSILPLLPPYQGLTLLTAIAQVLKNHEGEKVNADTVVKELHGDLSTDKFRIAKERVTKNLSKGKIENKWDSVPDQTGLYTFSLSKLK